MKKQLLLCVLSLLMLFSACTEPSQDAATNTSGGSDSSVVSTDRVTDPVGTSGQTDQPDAPAPVGEIAVDERFRRVDSPVTLIRGEEDGLTVYDYYSVANRSVFGGFQMRANRSVTQWGSPLFWKDGNTYITDWLTVRSSDLPQTPDAAKWDDERTNEPQIGGEAPSDVPLIETLFSQVTADGSKMIRYRWEFGTLSVCFEALDGTKSDASFELPVPSALTEAYSYEWMGRTETSAVLGMRYRELIAAFCGDTFYFDFWDNDGTPVILWAGKSSSESVVFRIGARHPAVSKNGEYFAYQQAENASADGSGDWKTVLEKNGKPIKTFSGARVVLMDDGDGEIYVLDPQTGAAEIYAMADLSQTTLSLPEGWIFPQITDGKLRLFCPQSGTPVYAVIEEAER